MSDLDDPFDCCPICGVFGGAVWLGIGTYGVCDRHRLRWLVQVGGYHWSEDWETVAAYREVPRRATRTTMNVLKARLDPDTYDVIAAWATARQGRYVHLAYDSEGGCFNASHEGELDATFIGPGRVALTLRAGPREAVYTTTRCYPASEESDSREYEAAVHDGTLYVYGPEGAGAYCESSPPPPPRADGMPF